MPSCSRCRRRSSRQSSIRTTDGGAKGAEAVELADLFCRQAELRIDALFGALWKNTDARDMKASEGLLEGKYHWLDEGIVDLTEGTGPWISDEDFGPPRSRTSAATRTHRCEVAT